MFGLSGGRKSCVGSVQNLACVVHKDDIRSTAYHDLPPKTILRRKLDTAALPTAIRDQDQCKTNSLISIQPTDAEADIDENPALSVPLVLILR